MGEYQIESLEVAAVYQAVPPQVRQKLLQLRQMIFDIAQDTDTVGKIDETLKWGVPSYLTHHPKSGTTIRLQWAPATKRYGIFVHCQTSLISDFKQEFSTDLAFDKNRGIVFDEDSLFPANLIQEFLKRALTYHIRPT